MFLRRDAANTEVNRPVRERNIEQKAGVKWPKANSNRMGGSQYRFVDNIRYANDRLEKMGDIIYSYGVERFGMQDKKEG